MEQPLTAPPLTESNWTSRVIAIASLHGWRVHHARPARTTQGWRTPVQGHIGAPDLLLARRGEVICAELKVGKNKLRPDQQLWADAIGDRFRLWRPEDSDDVLKELAW